MAVGKSAIGRTLARKLRRRFVDLDRVIERAEGSKVREIFEREGEAYFRQLEKQALATVLEANNQVIATGGGVILDDQNIQILRDKAVLIGLSAEMDVLLARAGDGTKRPLLQGSNRREKIEDLSTEDFDKTIKTNLYALHWIAQAAVPHMPVGSAVITTASIQAYQPSPILLDYATTKAGIVAYTKALAKQLIERGIRANVVAPGPVWTVLQPSGGQPDERVKNFGKDSDFGRPGQPVELAPVFVLLASSEASFINGEVYGVTGGKGIA